MLCSVLPIPVLFIFRKNRKLVNKLLIIMFVFIFLALFELPLTQFEGHRYNVIGYRDPEVILQDSGIHIMAVSIINIYFSDDEKEIRENYGDEDLYSFIKITNKDVYMSKLNWFRSVLGLYKSEFDRMRENVFHYLGDDIEVINEFLQREDMEGDSAGLALGVIAQIDKGELENGVQVGITGTLEKDGVTKRVSAIEEKLMIAEKNDLAHFILPQENLAEAEEAKEKHLLKIELYPVSHINEAIDVINQLNNKDKL